MDVKNSLSRAAGKPIAYFRFPDSLLEEEQGDIRHCERSEATQGPQPLPSGLLRRFASRNDRRASYYPTPLEPFYPHTVIGWDNICGQPGGERRIVEVGVQIGQDRAPGL